MTKKLQMRVKRRPDIVVSISLVGHGFQIDVFDYTRASDDGNGVIHSASCRDFGGTYDVVKIADAATAALIEAMQKLERTRLRSPKK